MQKADVRRFTVRIPADIHLALKLRAVSTETGMGELMKGMITEYLAGGIRPGGLTDVHLTSNATIAGTMQSEKGPIPVEFTLEELKEMNEKAAAAKSKTTTER